MIFSIRESLASDMPGILRVIHAVFDGDQGREISDLAEELLEDQSALPVLSLVATHDDRIVGHVLFSATRFKNSPFGVQSSILAPLSVHPDFQNKGIGGQLVNAGFEHLRTNGVGIAFVLGHPGYYRRHGFVTAGAYCFEAPYPIPEEHADAWMVKELLPGLLGTVHGLVECAKPLDDPKHWIE